MLLIFKITSYYDCGKFCPIAVVKRLHKGEYLSIIQRMKVEICIGSSCHVKGGKEVLGMLTKAIKDKGLDSKVALAGSTCMGMCKEPGVSIKVDGNPFSVTMQDFDSFFEKEIASKV